jgi:Tol biopolymer transport system component
VKQLTSSAGSKRHAAWSPDGTQIVYYGSEGSGYDYELWKINSDGTGAFRLTNDTFDQTIRRGHRTAPRSHM